MVGMEELKKEEIKLKKMLSENIEKQKQLKIKSFFEKHGFDIGDSVEWEKGNKMVAGVITGFELKTGSVMPLVKRANSKGQLLKREEIIWPWTLKTMKLTVWLCVVPTLNKLLY